MSHWKYKARSVVVVVYRSGSNEVSPKSACEYLVSDLWRYLDRFRRLDIARRCVSLGRFAVSAALGHSICFLLPFYGLRYEFLPCSSSYTLAAKLPYHDGDELSGNINPDKSVLLLVTRV